MELTLPAQAGVAPGAAQGPQPVQETAGHRAMCANCSLAPLCLPMGLDREQLPRGEKLIKRRKLKRGSFLYRVGEPFSSLFAVKTGSFKRLSIAGNGEYHISGFAIPGDLMGLDGLAGGEHAQDVLALESAEVCELRYSRLREAAQDLPALLHHFHVLLGEQIVVEQEVALLLRRLPVEQRLAVFLSTLVRHNARRGLESAPVRLSMQRRDIANHLGMTAESLSRSLSLLKKRGEIRVDQRIIEVGKLACARDYADTKSAKKKR